MIKNGLLLIIIMVAPLSNQLKVGLDRISDFPQYFKGKRLGLVTNPTGLSEDFKSGIDIFFAQQQLVALFGPEHGIRGDQQDGVQIPTQIDPYTGLTVQSLYGPVRRPTKEMLDKIDVLIQDIQDVGARFYTFIATMLECMRACAENNKIFIVLDRPNPLGGEIVEGPILREKQTSFVGPGPIPVRQGLTPGELALFFKKEFKLNVEMQVVPMVDWKRSMLWGETGRYWFQTSPNIPTKDSALVYAGMCFLEATNMSVARGTTRPFEVNQFNFNPNKMIGSPWVEWQKLVLELEKYKLQNVKFIPTQFTPSTSVNKGESCQGVQIIVTNEKAFEAVETGAAMVQALRKAFPSNFKISVNGMNLLVGEDSVSGGQVSWDDLITRWRQESKDFKEKSKEHYLYT